MYFNQSSTGLTGAVPTDTSLDLSASIINPAVRLERAPLGATCVPGGVTFTVHAPCVERIELLLFGSASDTAPQATIQLASLTNGRWGAFVPGLIPGQLYAYRVTASSDPLSANYLSPNNLLVDPYAKALTPELRSNQLPLPQVLNVVVPPSTFDWGSDTPPRTPLQRSVILEAHVRGLTKLFPGIPEEIQGTFAALGHPAVVEALKGAGYTAIELLPVNFCMTELFLREKGLLNYWGYNPLSFFALDPWLASSKDPVAVINEFKGAVKSLHSAGIEVIIDVVFNHTAEGGADYDEHGTRLRAPTLSLRGFDSRYYLHHEGKKVDHTGCGNTIDPNYAPARQLILDALRYFVEELHVDGFRFDAAPVLGRTNGKFLRNSFYEQIANDPLLSKCKLIVEPWSAGPHDDAFHLGNFPPGIQEWNGCFRDVVRRFWRGDSGMLPDFATVLYGSDHIFGSHHEGPLKTINFITAHDGRTLADLVQYKERHNLANGEDNRDGWAGEIAWNCDIEGPSSDPKIIEQRHRQMRSMLATLFLAHGIPMVLAGDDRIHSQLGNNNAYCHDSVINWLSWQLNPDERQMAKFLANLIAFRKAFPVLQRDNYQGNLRNGIDLTWYTENGEVMQETETTGSAHWSEQERRVVGVYFSPHTVESLGPARAEHETLFAIFNANSSPVEFLLPHLPDEKERWYQLVFDTALAHDPFDPTEPIPPGQRFVAQPWSVAVFRYRTWSAVDSE